MSVCVNAYPIFLTYVSTICKYPQNISKKSMDYLLNIMQ